MKSFYRFLSRNRLYTAIEVGGMALSLAFVTIIGSFLIGQFTCDKELKSRDDLHIAQSDDMYIMSGGVKEILEGKFPEVEDMCRVITTDILVAMSMEKKYGDISEKQNSFAVDENFLAFIPYTIVSGDPESALMTRNGALVSEECARRLFQDEDPMGKSITVNIEGKEADVMVTGVFRNFTNSVIPDCDMIYRIDIVEELAPEALILGNTSVWMLFDLINGADVETLSEKALKILKEEDPMYSMEYFNEFSLRPFESIQFSGLRFTMPFKGIVPRNFVMMFLAAGILLLIFAILNYTSLTIAQTGFRAKEMATRRLVGAQKGRIIFSYLSETFVLTLTSFLLGLIIAQALTPSFSTLIGMEISLFRNIGAIHIISALSLITVLSVIAGILPALIVSGNRPIDIVRGTFTKTSKMTMSRIIIIFQNIVAAVTLSLATVMFCQLRHMLSKPMGYQRDNIIQVGYASRPQNYFLDELKQLPFVEKVGWASMEPMTIGMAGMETKHNGETIKIDINTYDTTAIDIIGFEIITQTADPSEYSIYLSESARIALGETYGCKNVAGLNVCGFVKDWKKGSIDSPEAPGFLKLLYINRIHPEDQLFGNLTQLVVKVNGDEKEAVEEIKKFYTEKLKGLDDSVQVASYNELFERLYEKESNNMKLISLFTLLTLLLSSLGMLAMSTYYSRQHAGNVALKKVYGCSRRTIFIDMASGFLSSVVIALAAALPLAWLIAEQWLSAYSYRIDNSVWLYLAAGAAIAMMALASISWQTVRLMNTNPVESLKNE